jgi:conjugative transfer signal peptidase TraF
MSASSTDAGEPRDARVQLSTFRHLMHLRGQWRRALRRTTWRDFAGLAAAFVGLAAAAVLWHRSGLVFNHTASMPVGFYRVQRMQRARGDEPAQRISLTRGVTVVWCLPERLVGQARRRGYLVRGRCPGGVEPMLKTVVAIPGDSVVVDSAGMTVNGWRLPNSRPLTFDSRGRRLTGIPRGKYVVPPGQAWLWSPYHASSFDSRYYGAVPVSGLVGLARPVWTRRTSTDVARHAPAAVRDGRPIQP